MIVEGFTEQQVQCNDCLQAKVIVGKVTKAATSHLLRVDPQLQCSLGAAPKIHPANHKIGALIRFLMQNRETSREHYHGISRKAEKARLQQFSFLIDENSTALGLFQLLTSGPCDQKQGMKMKPTLIATKKANIRMKNTI